MEGKNMRWLIIASVLISISLLAGCAGMEYAPKEPSIIWFYPKELPAAERAVEAARQAGKDKECPAAFNEAYAMKEEAYKIYWACRDQEAIDMAIKATEKAQALCPVISAPAAPAAPAPPKPPASAKKPVRIVLEDIHFSFDTATLNSRAIAILDRNAERIMDNPSVSVQIEGHACAHGTEEYNMALSERRAQAAKEYLMNKGIASKRMSTIAYGESRLAKPEIPTRDNKESPEARANRRVHFEVTE